jgi:hypothetical protein
MTNTRGVFKASLEEIKRHDDMNFITGINHSVLHGYNYSPAMAGFPGWVRFGSYFNEHNTWWPYFGQQCKKHGSDWRYMSEGFDKGSLHTEPCVTGYGTS